VPFAVQKARSLRDGCGVGLQIGIEGGLAGDNVIVGQDLRRTLRKCRELVRHGQHIEHNDYFVLGEAAGLKTIHDAVIRGCDSIFKHIAPFLGTTKNQTAMPFFWALKKFKGAGPF
jgi:hypothetical protein